MVTARAVPLADASGVSILFVPQMEFACSHVVCDWRPDGAGERRLVVLRGSEAFFSFFLAHSVLLKILPHILVYGERRFLCHGVAFLQKIV